MDILSLILAFIFGAVIGSFLNVVALRFDTGKGLNGRSGCMSCGRTLTWRELIPIFSFMAQKGRCRQCSSPISWQYPLVEAGTGALFVLIFISFPPVSSVAGAATIIQAVAACLLVVITAYDVRHKIIPDRFVYAFDTLALASLFTGGASWWHVPGWPALIAGPLLALPFALIWLLSKGTWMGLGDAKLTLGIGWFLGLNGGVNALVLAFWIAAAASVIWMLVRYGGFKRKTEIPFGPYLILGMYLVLFFHLRVLDLSILKDILFSRS